MKAETGHTLSITAQEQRMGKEDGLVSKVRRRQSAVPGEVDTATWWASGLVFRAACSLLGLACGLVMALLIVAVGMSIGQSFAQMQSLLLAGALAGAAGGAAAPEMLIKAIAGLSYFLMGWIAAWGGGEPPEAPRNDGWLTACAVFGALYAVALSILWTLLR
ncbi:hypothetical protein ASF11_10820 [Acidovorax sp. Leaf76]|uniref:hypothetical protein n=1 Tax=unclassified Acidovorax TaxID=2684926 RepID=UPI000701AFB3|nr:MULTISPECIES: hypothetical protein [unclassified Acidovorax]KQO15085.1 hypothetical protein ASF11_10820 [Acidovorax sp. Leaf76]KQO31895.1 hypothetical protein ASF19_10010 [Acidovorax sp. Leaf84]KQS28956.1 hypothetical protein ASG27_11875 [Acidovorax sp. Leaf191]RYF63082.1 MAG: hypothetical protein EOO29_44815 [Comamonadaceae bacterium]